MDCIFHQDYLEGYFELISNNVKGDYFIDWNRFLLQDADFSSKKEHKQEGQISGYSLSKGNFSGSVKLYSQATKNTYSKSDVLVCDFLDINMIQDLQSCGAILIEKGNVLSHMAIVAREFKKPCVIGVKFATKILKDGDMVEVDANKGVVTKLS
jgi:pyruvate,water dikinase